MPKFCIASYHHFLNGKPTNLGGPAQHLAKYLGKQAVCIWQPIQPNRSFFYYFFLKFRDIFLVLVRHKPADVFVGVESINALLGKLLGYKKVIYWNMDYSPRRQWIWNFLDMLALRYSDEVWTLKDRGVGKVVPIGCWFDEIPRLSFDKIEQRGIVYIGLVQEGQGVGILLNEAIKLQDVRVTIIGTGKDLKKYQQLFKHYDNIKFTGLISDYEANKIMCSNAYGWAVYHPSNKTHKTTLPTKPMIYSSCGMAVIHKVPIDFEFLESKREASLIWAKQHDWNLIFKNALRSDTDNKG